MISLYDEHNFFFCQCCFAFFHVIEHFVARYHFSIWFLAITVDMYVVLINIHGARIACMYGAKV